MNNHEKSALNWPTGSTFSHIRSIKLPSGKSCLGYPRPYNKALNLPSQNTDFMKRSFAYAGPQLWNSLPNSIKSAGLKYFDFDVLLYLIDRIASLLKSIVYATLFIYLSHTRLSLNQFVC